MDAGCQGTCLQGGFVSGNRINLSTGKRERHGESKTPLHRVWGQMRQRCNNKNATDYEHYGARGINVCDEWNQSYIAFRDWANANGYRRGLQIDRRNNSDGYSPDNCRWVTGKQNAANTRSHKCGTSKYKGVSWKAQLSKWVSGICKDGKPHHIGLFQTPLAAALAYDDMAYAIRGQYALLNFPERKRGMVV